VSLAIKDIPFFKGLTEAELAAVGRCIKEKTFEKGESLFLEGNACERVFFVKSGRVKLYRTSSSGREQILETLGAGNTCACNPGSAAWSCASSAEALTPCTAWFLSRENYVRLVQAHSKLAHALNRLFAERLRCFSSLIEEVSLKDSKRRLIKFLLDMLKESQKKHQERKALAIPFTREELAQRIGVARETVARQLYQLKGKKLIDIKPHEIIIQNKAGLEKLL
jgi:CRP/FNR family transcriptional regulator